MADAIFEPEVKRSLVWLQQEVEGDVPPIAIECKKTMEARLSFDNVRDHQIANLLDFERYGLVRKLIVSQGFGKAKRFTGDTPYDFIITGAGHGFFLVNFRFTKRAPRSDIAKGTNRCFAVPVQQYVEAKEEAQANGKASLSYDWFVAEAFECERIRRKNGNGNAESGWDLVPLVANLKTEGSYYVE